MRRRKRGQKTSRVMSRQVQRLLGPADENLTLAPLRPDDGWLYWLGGRGINPRALIQVRGGSVLKITFGKEGTVTQRTILQDAW